MGVPRRRERWTPEPGSRHSPPRTLGNPLKSCYLVGCPKHQIFSCSLPRVARTIAPRVCVPNPEAAESQDSPWFSATPDGPWSSSHSRCRSASGQLGSPSMVPRATRGRSGSRVGAPLPDSLRLCTLSPRPAPSPKSRKVPGRHAGQKGCRGGERRVFRERASCPSHTQRLQSPLEIETFIWGWRKFLPSPVPTACLLVGGERRRVGWDGESLYRGSPIGVCADWAGKSRGAFQRTQGCWAAAAQAGLGRG